MTQPTHFHSVTDASVSHTNSVERGSLEQNQGVASQAVIRGEQPGYAIKGIYLTGSSVAQVVDQTEPLHLANFDRDLFIQLDKEKSIEWDDRKLERAMKSAISDISPSIASWERAFGVRTFTDTSEPIKLFRLGHDNTDIDLSSVIQQSYPLS